MRFTTLPSGGPTNLSSLTDDVLPKIINVTKHFLEDFLKNLGKTHINVTHDIAKKLTNVTQEGGSSLIKDDVAICDFIVSNYTSGNVTTTVTSYNPAACGVYGSYPFLQPLLIFILVCFILWAVFGNSCLVGIISTDKNMQEPGNIFLCAMAFVDVAQSFKYAPIAIISLIYGVYPGEHWCRMQAFLVPFLNCLSVYLQTSLWICRYIHISRPLEYRSVMTRGRLALSLASCFLLSVAVPLVGVARVGTVLTWTTNAASVDIAEPMSLMMPCKYGGPESVIAVNLCFVGLVISCCFAGLIYKEARKSQEKHNRKKAWRAQADKLEKKLKAAKTLGIVVGVQWCTWIPMIIVSSLSKIGVMEMATFTFYGDIAYVIMQTSTFSDSIVYAFRNKIYRKALAKLYRKIKIAFSNL